MIVRTVIGAVLALALSSVPAFADEAKPLWEVGIAVGAGVAPDYPAADEYSFRVLPLPYFVYRGKIFRSEETGLLRGRFINRERVEVDISLAGAVDVNSSKNEARSGMPDLDWMGQIGPRLQLVLARAERDAHIDFELPVRAVFATDLHSHVDYIGVMSVPELAYQHDNFLDTGLHLKLSVGVTFADRRFQDVIYGVEPAFATAARPAYEARGGYMGSKLQLAWWKPVGSWVRVFGLLRGDFHQGSVNEESPLFRSHYGGTVIVGAVWTFLRSRAVVVE